MSPPHWKPAEARRHNVLAIVAVLLSNQARQPSQEVVRVMGKVLEEMIVDGWDEAASSEPAVRIDSVESFTASAGERRRGRK